MYKLNCHSVISGQFVWTQIVRKLFSELKQRCSGAFVMSAHPVDCLGFFGSVVQAVAQVYFVILFPVKISLVTAGQAVSVGNGVFVYAASAGAVIRVKGRLAVEDAVTAQPFAAALRSTLVNSVITRLFRPLVIRIEVCEPSLCVSMTSKPPSGKS